jgi:hypothetical protein
MTGLLPPAVRPAYGPNGTNLIWPSVLMFAYGAGWSFTVNAFGSLYAAEILALISIPFIGVNRVLGRYASLRNVLAAFALILLGLIIADFVNDTPFEQSIKGWATPVSGAVALMFVVSVLERNPRAIFGYFIGTALFSLIIGPVSDRFSQSEVNLSWDAVLMDTNYFKVRYVPFIMPFLIFTIQIVQLKFRTISLIICFVSALGFMILDARSAGLTLFTISLVTGAVRALQSVHLSSKTLVIVVASLLIAYLGYAVFISFVLAEGAGGQTARQIAQIENPYNPLQLLGVGRSEWLVAQDVIMNRPFFGYGSWAYDLDGRFAYLRAEMTNDLEAYMSGSASQLYLIPTHSVLLTSWIWGGLIGFAGAILLALTIIKLIIKNFALGMPLVVISTFFFITIIWDFLFSPFQTLRLTFPHALGFIIVSTAVPVQKWFAIKTRKKLL